MLWDVLVIGAGPAGCAAATLLCKEGFSVLVLERSAFPRFQIGESLLPVCLPVLERLGLEVRADSHLYKRGAEFVREDRGQSRVFDFRDVRAGHPCHAFQVDRTVFDARLSEHASRHGARLLHGIQVSSVELASDRVRVRSLHQEFEARYLVDASGQGRFLARRHGSAVPYQGFGSAAAFVHFEGIAEAVFAEFAPAHDIRVMLAEHGWGWVIPLPGRRLSVGLVTRRRGVKGDLEAYLEASPSIRRWTRGAQRGEPRVVKNFSYSNQRPHGERFVCIGDAACFLDPVFSSGVSLALLGAEGMVTSLLPALRDSREADPTLMQPLAASMRRGYATFAAMIDRFYNTQFVDHFLFGSGSDPELTQGIVSVLAGDVFRDGNRFQRMLLDSRRNSVGFFG